MRVTVKLQGEDNAQALFDVVRGHSVRWRELGAGWHSISFDCASVDDAKALVIDLCIGRHYVSEGA